MVGKSYGGAEGVKVSRSKVGSQGVLFVLPVEACDFACFNCWLGLVIRLEMTPAVGGYGPG